VRTDRPDGEVAAGVVIACDGVHSFLAKGGRAVRGLVGVALPGGRKGSPRASARGAGGPLQPHRRRGARHRDSRRHPGHSGRRLPVHQPGHHRGRRRALAGRAARFGEAPGGDHRRAQWLITWGRRRRWG
jgi:hypothetical protein